MSAKYHSNFTAFDVARYVFKGLKEPEARSLQAATYWASDLEVQEAIRETIANGPIIPGITKEALAQRALAIADNITEDTKNRIAALRLVAELNGEIIKAVDKRVSYPDAKGGIPSIVFKRYEDDAA